MPADRARDRLSVGGKSDGERGGKRGRNYLHTNKQQSLGPEQSLTEVETPPPNNSVKLHVLVVIKQQQKPTPHMTGGSFDRFKTIMFKVDLLSITYLFLNPRVICRPQEKY